MYLKPPNSSHLYLISAISHALWPNFAIFVYWNRLRFASPNMFSGFDHADVSGKNFSFALIWMSSTMSSATDGSLNSFYVFYPIRARTRDSFNQSGAREFFNQSGAKTELNATEFSRSLNRLYSFASSRWLVNCVSQFFWLAICHWDILGLVFFWIFLRFYILGSFIIKVLLRKDKIFNLKNFLIGRK